MWVLVVAAVVLPVAILCTAAWGAWHLTWADTERGLIRGAEGNAEYVARNFQSLTRTAHHIAQIVAGMDGAASDTARAAVQDRIRDMLQEQPLVRAVAVHGDAGQRLMHLDAWMRSGPENDEPGGDIQEALAQAPPGSMAFGTVYRHGGEGPLLAIGLRSLPSGLAVIFVLDVTEIGAGLARHTEGRRDSAVLIRTDGQILAREPPFREPPPPAGAGQPLMLALNAGQDGGTLMGRLPQDGSPIAVAFCRITAVPGLVIAVGRRRAEIVEHWRQAMLPLLLVGLPAVIALMGLALVVRRQQDALEATLGGLEQRVAERTDSLREGEERLRLAVEAGQLGTWETELSNGISTRSPRSIAIMGFNPDEPSAPVEDWAKRLHPADRRRVLDQWRRLSAGRLAVYREEYRFLRADGAWRWLESTGAVVRADPGTGKPLRLAGTIQDITERHDAEERRELLTQEVNHRARNTLAMVQAILRLTQAGSPAEYAQLVEGRVSALARAQSLLAAERWSGAPLGTLVADELVPFGGIEARTSASRGRFNLDGPAFRIRSEAVQAFGMLFHELATNAAKHGALSVPQGHVTVAWLVDEAEGQLRIRWTESGGPHPGFPARRGVGSRVIEATVVGQLGGSVERRWPDEGLICDIVVPLGRSRAGPA